MRFAGEHVPSVELIDPMQPMARWFQLTDIDGDAGTVLLCSIPLTVAEARLLEARSA